MRWLYLSPPALMVLGVALVGCGGTGAPDSTNNKSSQSVGTLVTVQVDGMV
jgi:hypothetical protein